MAFCLCTNFDGREPESQLAKDIDRKVFEARNNKQWRREYMSYQMELDKQFRNGREEERRNINKLNKALLSEKKYEIFLFLQQIT